MVERVIGTTAVIDLSEEEPEAGDLVVEVTLLADIQIDGQRAQRRGASLFAPIELDRDPTNQLVQAANLERETNLGTLFGDLMIAGPVDFTRFDFYSAPFRIELTDKLRARLAGAWESRDPRT